MLRSKLLGCYYGPDWQQIRSSSDSIAQQPIARSTAVVELISYLFRLLSEHLFNDYYFQLKTS